MIRRAIAVIIAAAVGLLILLRIRRPSRGGDFLASDELEQAKEAAEEVIAGEVQEQPIKAMRDAMQERAASETLRDHPTMPWEEILRDMREEEP
jgi:hypothetical protein